VLIEEEPQSAPASEPAPENLMEEAVEEAMVPKDEIELLEEQGVIPPATSVSPLPPPESSKPEDTTGGSEATAKEDIEGAPVIQATNIEEASATNGNPHESSSDEEGQGALSSASMEVVKDETSKDISEAVPTRGADDVEAKE
jgi:hypothetical protein